MIIKNGSIVYMVKDQEMVTVRGVKRANNTVYVEKANGKRDWVKLDDIQARPKIMRTKVENGVPLSFPDPSPETIKMMESSPNVTKTGEDEYTINDTKAFIQELDAKAKEGIIND